MDYVITTKNDLETKELAKRIARLLKATDVVLLTGDLGAGKTTFVGGALSEYGYNDHVISPTFNIMKCYFEVTPPVFHIDAYRLEGQNIEIGLEEFIEGNGITFIEWPKFIEPLIPNKHLEIEINRVDNNTREITVKDPNGFYEELIKKLGE
ncbi:MAG: tRNA (adenosine(37)-N6)-threonylcarbamoyltransferase complex ATPase subunit type 1 TsaE [Bacilli bacterium]|nr:tRNA (adenosine(37)-N6)-threonylcarbamoyltransferase complex ATPase subunit type 1 TsaE [Bacilli bacterium]